MSWTKTAGTASGRQYSYTNYRYGFNKQEKDGELGEYYSFEYRVHDARLGRFLSVDPLFQDYPFNSTYAFAENTVIWAKELEGLEAYYSTGGYKYSENQVNQYLTADQRKDHKPGEVYIFDLVKTKITYTVKIANPEWTKWNKKSGWDKFWSTEPSKLVDKKVIKEEMRASSADKLSCTENELKQFAANIYNEAFGGSWDDKADIAAAIVNRKNKSGSTLSVVLDKLAFFADNHSKKMSELDRKPGNSKAYPTNLGGSKTNPFTYSQVSAAKYREFYNSTSAQVNSNETMKDCMNVSIISLRGSLGVRPNVQNHDSWWGDGKNNHFYSQW